MRYQPRGANSMRSQRASLALHSLARSQCTNSTRAQTFVTRAVKRYSTEVNPIDNHIKEQIKSVPTSALPSSNASGRDELVQKAQIVFGSRLNGPAERQAEIDRESTLIAGVLVPPKPEEPDNCCMGGCVNCVYDRYRDELEEWAMKNNEAQAKLAAKKEAEKRKESSYNAAMSMDDDGGGSETNWPAPSNAPTADLFEGIPVGIREFMKTEKKLKEQRRAQAAAG